MAWGLKGGGGAIALRPNEGKGQRADASSKPALSADPELLEEVAKLALNTAQRGRAMEGVLFTYWIVPRNHEIVEAMDGKGREYATAVEGKAGEHGLGTPWRACRSISLSIHIGTGVRLLGVGRGGPARNRNTW